MNDETLDSVFNMWWPQLDSQIKAILSRSPTELNINTEENTKTEKEMLAEILELAQLNARRSSNPANVAISPNAVLSLLNHYIIVHDALADEEKPETILGMLKDMKSSVTYFVGRSRRSDELAAAYEKLEKLTFELYEIPF